MTPYLPVSIVPLISLPLLLESDYKLLEVELKDSSHQVCITCVIQVLHDVYIHLGECEYPSHPSNGLNFSSFIAVCRTGGGVMCDCPVINVCIRCNNFMSLCLCVYLCQNTVGLCPTTPTMPTASTPSEPTQAPRELPIVINLCTLVSYPLH